MLFGGGKLTSGDTNRHSGGYGLRFVLEAVEQLLCLIKATLQHTDLRESRGRVTAPRTLSSVCQLPDRRKELAFGSVDATVRGEDIRATRPAEGEERDLVVLAHEVLQHRAPLLRALGVTCEVAREHECAADIREGLQARRLSGRRRRHCLVEPGEAVVHPPGRDLG